MMKVRVFCRCYRCASRCGSGCVRMTLEEDHTTSRKHSSCVNGALLRDEET